MNNGKLQPKISVCIPVHNAELWLAESIESIESQTFQDWQIVIVDDYSEDASQAIIQHFKEKLGNKLVCTMNSENEGIAFTRNKANALAKGEIIVVQDADDYSHPQRLEKTWKFFKRHKSVDLVYGSYQTMDVFGKPMTQYDAEPFNKERLLEHNYIAHPTVAYRSGNIRYRSLCRVLDDWFLYMDYIKAGKKIAHMDDVLSFYRILPTSVSHSKTKETEEMRAKFLKEACEYSDSLRH